DLQAPGFDLAQPDVVEEVRRDDSVLLHTRRLDEQAVGLAGLQVVFLDGDVVADQIGSQQQLLELGRLRRQIAFGAGVAGRNGRQSQGGAKRRRQKRGRAEGGRTVR